MAGLRAGYGAAAVLHGVSLMLEEGRSLALLERNGVGETTLLDTLVGVTRYVSGSIRLGGEEISRWSPERRAAAGIGWAPQERNIFRSLTVEENLTAVARPGRWSVAEVYRLFPRLQERRRNMRGQLSGGEQQMLAIGRALALNPRLLLLDEPTEGLAPVIVDELMAALGRIDGNDRALEATVGDEIGCCLSPEGHRNRGESKPGEQRQAEAWHSGKAGGQRVSPYIGIDILN